MRGDQMICPKCGNDECWQDSADISVGVIYGPWGCPCCGWSDSEEYDLSGDKDPVDEKGGVIDQYGSYHPPGSPRSLAFKLMKQIDEGKK